MFWFFGKKKEIEKIKDSVKNSFESVKDDFNKVGKWISHFDGKAKQHHDDISDLKQQVSIMQNDLQEIKDFMNMFGPAISKQLFKQQQTAVGKQPLIEAVQTPVQTAVQTGVFANLTLMERVIVLTLLNSEMKLSYEDLSAMLGKNKATIRGQINTIRQKSEGLIEESREINGKKRLYIPEKMRNYIVKSVKVRVKSNKKVQNDVEK